MQALQAYYRLAYALQAKTEQGSESKKSGVRFIGIIRDRSRLDRGVQSRQGANYQNWTEESKSIGESICDVTLGMHGGSREKNMSRKETQKETECNSNGVEL